MLKRIDKILDADRTERSVKTCILNVFIGFLFPIIIWGSILVTIILNKEEKSIDPGFVLFALVSSISISLGYSLTKLFGFKKIGIGYYPTGTLGGFVCAVISVTLMIIINKILLI